MLISCSKPMVFCQKSNNYEPVFSSSLFRGFYFIESLRSKILLHLKKNLDEKFWKRKKLEKIFKDFPDFFRNLKIFETFWKIENFRKSPKIQKISRFFEKFSKSICNFLRFQNFSSRFFLRLGKSFLRSDSIK